ncbi:MAG: hypothetical protein P4N41_11835 [Negativicutes bacterium]|nr:hypothetical protein [Negativicutes bacterium]
MAVLFREKAGRFGSLISLIAVTAMLALFFLAMPDALVSVWGRAFAVVWALTAILVFTAHARRLSGERRRHPRYMAEVRDVRTKKQGERRFLRG